MQEIYYAIIGITLSVIYIFYVIIERLLIRYYRKKIPLKNSSKETMQLLPFLPSSIMQTLNN